MIAVQLLSVIFGALISLAAGVWLANRSFTSMPGWAAALLSVALLVLGGISGYQLAALIPGVG